MDEGAEALLARRPEGIELITAVGPGRRPGPGRRHLVRHLHQGRDAAAAAQAVHGRARRPGRARRDRGRSRPRASRGRGTRPRCAAEAGDVSVTEYIGSRLGAEIVDRLVDPLLGGVYAGRSEDLSFTATLAPLAAAAREHATLTGAAASLLPPARPVQPSPAAARAPPRPGTRAGRRHAGPGLRLADQRARRAARGGRQGVGRGRPHQRDGPRAQRAPRPAGGSPSAPRPTPSTWTPTR